MNSKGGKKHLTKKSAVRHCTGKVPAASAGFKDLFLSVPLMDSKHGAALQQTSLNGKGRSNESSNSTVNL